MQKLCRISNPIEKSPAKNVFTNNEKKKKLPKLISFSIRHFTFFMYVCIYHLVQKKNCLYLFMFAYCRWWNSIFSILFNACIPSFNTKLQSFEWMNEKSERSIGSDIDIRRFKFSRVENDAFKMCFGKHTNNSNYLSVNEFSFHISSLLVPGFFRWRCTKFVDYRFISSQASEWREKFEGANPFVSLLLKVIWLSSFDSLTWTLEYENGFTLSPSLLPQM